MASRNPSLGLPSESLLAKLGITPSKKPESKISLTSQRVASKTMTIYLVWLLRSKFDSPRIVADLQKSGLGVGRNHLSSLELIVLLCPAGKVTAEHAKLLLPILSLRRNDWLDEWILTAFAKLTVQATLGGSSRL
jgi:hypothetical protein